MKNPEFSLRESMERAFKRWWVIVLLTVLGGIAGWAFHFFNPPLYQATAEMTLNMDFQKRQLTQYEEDYAFDSAGVIAGVGDVVYQIVAEAGIRGIPIDLTQLQQEMFIERRQSVWELHIRDRNPEIAAELANIWVEKFYAALNVALGHAIRADQIQAQIDNINSSWLASGSPVLSAEDQTTLNTLSNEQIQEQRASQGIISIMKFAITGSATVPRNPILYHLADLVLAGACIGFILSLWVVNSYKVRRDD